MPTLRAATLAALAITAALAGPARADSSADYKNGYALGQQAYEYGLPLLDTDRVFRTETSIDVADQSGDGPINHFNSLPRLAIPSPSQKTVVAPNHDTLYSIAWLDLSRGAQVIHVPPVKDRFFVLPLYTPWTEDFYNITSNPSGPAGRGDYGVTNGGDYAVVPPGFHGRIPGGVKRIDAPYDRLWIIGRTLIRGDDDTPAVNAIQRGYTISPLSRYGKPYRPHRARHPRRTLTYATVPGSQAGEDPLAFYTALNAALARFPGPAADRPLLDRLRPIDVGPGLDPAHDAQLSPATLQGMRDAVAQGPANLQSELTQYYLSNSLTHGGYLVVPTGTYGTNYQLRALVDKVGLGAPTPDIAVYPLAQTDRTLQALDGSKSYVLHVPKGKLPPARAFWSLTMYDLAGFFVPNPLDRYLLNDRTPLHDNPDGSLDLYIQHTEPSRPEQRQNWLPAPAGTFRLIWRVYDSGSALPGILDGTGWQAPAIQSCVAGLGVPELTPCAG